MSEIPSTSSLRKLIGRLLRSGVFSLAFALLSVSAAFAAYKFALGKASPFTGNKSSDLATIHVHVAPNFWNISGSIHDSGSIVLPNVHAPKSKGPRPCGDEATDCVYEPALFMVRAPGFKQIRRGNEVAYLNSMMFAEDVTWQRLPGPLVVRLYVRGYPLSGMPSGSVASDRVVTTAGGSYSFAVVREQAPGGSTIKIVPQ
jgi:hypothetical protein